MRENEYFGGEVSASDIQFQIFRISKHAKVSIKILLYLSISHGVFMVSKKIVVIAVVLIIIIALLAVFVLPLVSESPPAVLSVEAGTVEVSHRDQIFRHVTGEITLNQGDIVRTGVDSSASVTLFGSSIVRLESNTEITIAELVPQKGSRSVSIDQKTGRVWSRVLKLSGVDDYSIKTPSSVATIRGTGFDHRINADQSVDISVVDGIVGVARTADQASADVISEKAITIGDAQLLLRALIRDSWISGNEQEDKSFLIELREKIKQKYWIYILLAKSQYGLTDKEIDAYIDGALTGKYTQSEITAALEQFGVELKL